MKATVQEVFARIPLHRAAGSAAAHGRAIAAPAAKSPGDEALASALAHGTMTVELYAPRGRDRQTSHKRDELYFIVSGRGDFVHGARRDEFGPGDAFFVPAHMEHRFENFSDDFTTWVVFYGPEGGELP